MQAYIRGIGVVSPQKTFDSKEFLTDVVEYDTNLLRCIEPSYKDFLNPALARRMGRIIKMSIAASSICLDDADVKIPDAIITATALGCHEDTEKFLLSIIDNDEQFLTPTSFMQSTHNTVSAQIALQLKCVSYNFTYVHKGFSFESAVLDGLMTLEEGSAHDVLIGSHDEMTERHFKITSRVNHWKKEHVKTRDLISSKTIGSVAGEGAAFFLLSDQPGAEDYAKLEAVKTIYRPENSLEVGKKIIDLLDSKGLSPDDVDAVIYGINGDVRFDHIYYEIKNSIFRESTSVYFKHLCGEYQTSSSFATYVASNILHTQTIPEILLIDENKRKTFKNVLIYNSYMNIDHSIFLLSRC